MELMVAIYGGMQWINLFVDANAGAIVFGDAAILPLFTTIAAFFLLALWIGAPARARVCFTA